MRLDRISLQAFRRVFALKLALIAFPFSPSVLPQLLVGVVASAGFLLAWKRLPRLGLLLLLVPLATTIIPAWPYTINHRVFEAIVLLVLALSSSEEEAFSAKIIKFLILSVWFYAGVQKLLHGYYLSGEWFALHAVTYGADSGGLVDLLVRQVSARSGFELPSFGPCCTTAAVSFPTSLHVLFVALGAAVVVAEMGLPLLALYPPHEKFWLGGIASTTVGHRLLFGRSGFRAVEYGVPPPISSVLGGLDLPRTRRPYASHLGVRVTRRGLIFFLLGIALAWPPLQMAGSVYFGFSPWRLFGWGMYSVPHPEAFTTVRIIFPEGMPSKECVPAKPIHPRLRVFTTKGRSFRAFSPCKTSSRAQDLIQRLLHFRDKTVLFGLVGEFAPESRAMVLLTDQRLSLDGQTLYTLTTAYVCRKEGCAQRGDYDSRNEDVRKNLFGNF